MVTDSFLPEAPSASTLGTLSPWESIIVDAVGNVIEFWQFKRNHGRVWALLYLRDRALPAADLQHALGLSKGAVSMLVRDLEHWSVIRRVRDPQDPHWRFEAEPDLLALVRHVVRQRELSLVTRVRADLERAEAEARAATADRATLQRIASMRLLAVLVEKAIAVFLSTARLDVGQALRTLWRKDTPDSHSKDKPS